MRKSAHNCGDDSIALLGKSGSIKDLWRQLEAKFRHEKTIFLPKARHDWANLRVYDFSNFSSYNNELFKIVSQLHLCGVFILRSGRTLYNNVTYSELNPNSH